jgi:fructokinase
VIAGELRRSGVRNGLDRRVDLPTPIAVAGLDSQGSASYWFHLERSSAFALDGPEARQALAEPHSAVIVGCLGLVVNPMADALSEAIERRDAGDESIVMVDLNCRPSAVTERAAYLARVKRVLTNTDVVKVSTDDLGYLDPDHEALDAARRVLGSGPSVVLVTDGDKAVRVLTAASTFSVAVAPVEVVDTIGAGDAFSGGFLSWWVGHHRRRADLTQPDVVRQGVLAANEVAAITCSRVGADPPWASDLAGLERWRWLVPAD